MSTLWACTVAMHSLFCFVIGYYSRLHGLCDSCKIFHKKLGYSRETTRRSRSFKVTDFGTNRKLIYDFLLVISTNLSPILHLSEIQRSIGPKSLYLSTPLAFNPSDGGVPLGRYPQFFSLMSVDGQGTKIRRNIAKISTDRVRCTNVADDRQTTDGRATAYSESRSRSLKIITAGGNLGYHVA